MEKHTRTPFALFVCRLSAGLFSHPLAPSLLDLFPFSPGGVAFAYLKVGACFCGGVRPSILVPCAQLGVCELKPEWDRLLGVTMDTNLVAIAIPATTENHFDHLFGAIDMRPRENQFPFLHPLPSPCPDNETKTTWVLVGLTINYYHRPSSAWANILETLASLFSPELPVSLRFYLQTNGEGNLNLYNLFLCVFDYFRFLVSRNGITNDYTLFY